MIAFLTCATMALPLSFPFLARAQANGTAATPPMGWNSWNKFRSKVDDATVRAMADAMVTSGMRDAGYSYVNIDDTWEGERDAQATSQRTTKFPDMKALADYVHGKGLKLGIYSSPGPKTCAGFEGSLWARRAGREDLCSVGYRLPEVRSVRRCARSTGQTRGRTRPGRCTTKMGDALQATGRPIVYSLCQYGERRSVEVGTQRGRQPVAHHRRYLSDYWESMADHRLQPGRIWRSLPGPGIGMIPTCWRSATAA